MKDAALAIGVTLLQKSGVEEALLGDVVEEYSRRNSRSWLMRQVLGVVARQSLREARLNKGQAVRIVLMGSIISWLYGQFVLFPIAALDEWVFLRGLADFRPWWPQGPPALLAAALLGGCLTGWVLARVYRYPLVLFFVAVALGWQLCWLPFLLSVTAVPNEWVRPTALWQIVIGLLITPGGILFGALLPPKFQKE